MRCAYATRLDRRSVCCVTATDGRDPGATPATPRIDFATFDIKCAERGALDEAARAELVDVDRTTLWRWRNGRQTPTLAQAVDIAERFGISVEELIGRVTA